MWARGCAIREKGIGMMNHYEIREVQDIISPSLIYYIDIIRSNIEKAIAMAGSPERLCPHVKTHKAIDMVRLQMEYGITKFKASTIAEAEMAAEAGASVVILAYPAIGPNMERLVKLAKVYFNTVFYGIGDDLTQLRLLSEMCEANQYVMPVLVDVNMGMNRTGVEISGLEALCRLADTLPGIRLRGLHCYDGNHNQKDFQVRNTAVRKVSQRVNTVIDRLRKDGITCSFVIAGGTPSFPCHAGNGDWYLSPGTAMIMDAGYYRSLPDLTFIPGAAIMTRVISHPAKNIFTTDLGYKGIASDPVGQRGYIVGMEDAMPVVHSEEHWAFRLEDESRMPAVGSHLYVVPTHICPTSALYPDVLVAKNGKIVDVWNVTSRNRKITF